ncbi:IS3 family transposase [Gemmatimonadota bacterium]
MLKSHGIICSMSRMGDCYDNAAMESFFSFLKMEAVRGMTRRPREQIRKDLYEYIEVFYNRQRRHSSLGGISPAEYKRLNTPP